MFFYPQGCFYLTWWILFARLKTGFSSGTMHPRRKVKTRLTCERVRLCVSAFSCVGVMSAILSAVNLKDDPLSVCVCRCVWLTECFEPVLRSHDFFMYCNTWKRFLWHQTWTFAFKILKIINSIDSVGSCVKPDDVNLTKYDLINISRRLLVGDLVQSPKPFWYCTVTCKRAPQTGFRSFKVLLSNSPAAFWRSFKVLIWALSPIFASDHF